MTYQTDNSSLSPLQMSSRKLQYCTVCQRYWQRLQNCQLTPGFAEFIWESCSLIHITSMPLERCKKGK